MFGFFKAPQRDEQNGEQIKGANVCRLELKGALESRLGSGRVTRLHCRNGLMKHLVR
jgi:hypothetical protein